MHTLWPCVFVTDSDAYPLTLCICDRQWQHILWPCVFVTGSDSISSDLVYLWQAVTAYPLTLCICDRQWQHILWPCVFVTGSDSILSDLVYLWQHTLWPCVFVTGSDSIPSDLVYLWQAVTAYPLTLCICDRFREGVPGRAPGAGQLIAAAGDYHSHAALPAPDSGLRPSLICQCTPSSWLRSEASTYLLLHSQILTWGVCRSPKTLPAPASGLRPLLPSLCFCALWYTSTRLLMTLLTQVSGSPSRLVFACDACWSPWEMCAACPVQSYCKYRMSTVTCCNALFSLSLLIFSLWWKMMTSE